MQTRLATTDHAQGMSQVLAEIKAQTGRDRPTDEAFVIAHYIANPDGVRCTVALDDHGAVIGFQSLVRAVAGNRYNVPPGWGIIGTHISPRAHRQGVGRALFNASRQAAQQAGLEKIDAYIGADNPSALHYYEAMGFRTYRQLDGIIQKALDVPRPPTAP